jgi:indole-3-glycerol phosphate synthase
VTASFLAEVVAEVARAAAAPGYDDGVPSVRSRPPSSFGGAIERERSRGALVVEYKRRSPGTAEVLPSPRSVEEFVAATSVGAVAAYSCLATAHGFDGAPARVAELAARTDRPVLFKEFVVSRHQLEVAARTGAAAVLLIARLERERLLDEPLAELAGVAHRLGLEVLLELHDPAELSLVGGVEADVYGVNARDLGTLAFERTRAYTTLEQAAGSGLRPLLGLSGVATPADAGEFWRRGCDGILVGTAVARAREPARFLASLRRPEAGRA